MVASQLRRLHDCLDGVLENLIESEFPKGRLMPQTFPDFADLPLGEAPPSVSGSSVGRWAQLAGDAANRIWQTPENVNVKSLYTAADTAKLDFVDDWPGIAPFGRGPYPTMYTNQPWTI